MTRVGYLAELNKFIFGGLLSLGILFSTSNLAYAEQDLSFADSISDVNSLNNNSIGSHMDMNEYGYFYNYDKSGNVLFGTSYDDNGNIYYTEEEDNGPGASKVGVVRNKTLSNGLEYDDNGHLINIMNKKSSEYEQLCIDYENHKPVVVSSLDEVVDFLNYYAWQYSLNDIHLNDNKIEGCEEGYKIIYKDSYDRESIKNEIINKFGYLEGNTVEEKLLSLCLKIQDNMTYNLDYESLPLSSALKDNMGVCWQFCKIGNVLLDEAGIENEIWFGRYLDAKDSAHVWLRVKDGEKYYYCDPTQADNNLYYSNIAYNTYVNQYKPLSEYAVITYK